MRLARAAIAELCRDAESAFDPARLWPLHPADDEPGTPAFPGLDDL